MQQHKIPSIQSIVYKSKARSVSSFLKKTFALLNDQESQRVAKWADNGIGFIVLNQEQFAKNILPKYFKHSNYSSFVRQLNMYCFHKIRETNSESYFHHKNFDRDNKNSLAQIRRKPQKKKRKIMDGEDSQEEGKEQQVSGLSQNRQNTLFKDQKSQIVSNISTSKIVSEDGQSLRIITKDKSNQKQQINTARLLFPSQFTLKYKSLVSEPISWKKIDQSKWQHQDQNDDKISINNGIQQMSRLISFPTKELMCPSKHDILHFINKQTQNFNIFF